MLRYCLIFVFMLIIIVYPNYSNSLSPDSLYIKYGIIGRYSDSSDSLFEITNNCVLQTDDYFKINFSVENTQNFYVIYESVNHNFTLFIIKTDKSKIISEDHFPLGGWLQLDDKIGDEKIYLIAANEQLTNLEEIYQNYNDSRNKLKAKFAQDLLEELEIIVHGKKQKNYLSSRLENTEFIGATFALRGKDKIYEDSLLRICKGKGIVVEIIKIRHQK